MCGHFGCTLRTSRNETIANVAYNFDSANIWISRKENETDN